MTLEQQLVALCQKHDLKALSIGVHIREGSEPPFFDSYAHRDGKCGSSAVMRDSISGSVSEAIADVLAKCGEPAIAVPELEAA